MMPESLNRQTVAADSTVLRASSYSRRMRLATMVRIRWFAIVCQLATILIVAFGLRFLMPLVPCLLLMLCSVCLNLFLVFRYPANYRLSPFLTMVILTADVLLLSGLLYFTGGLTNPFALLLLAPAGLGATSLAVRHILALNLWVIAAATFLLLFHCPLPWYPDAPVQFPPLLIEGMWLGIVAALIFITACAYYVAEDARRLADALTATELVLQHEQHLSMLDGFAAAAAHELGTPLATIQLVVKELRHQLGAKPEFSDDMELLLGQTQRCREILQRFASLATEEDGYRSHLSFISLIEEVVVPYRDLGTEIAVQGGEADGPEPVFKRNPGMLYGIGNLVENAVDFARSQVKIDYSWNKKQIILIITDDGDGFAPYVLERIGEPYLSRRGADQTGGGLGLGVFIAKTLLERSGARVFFKNSSDKNRGAEIRIIWQNFANP